MGLVSTSVLFDGHQDALHECLKPSAGTLLPTCQPLLKPWIWTLSSGLHTASNELKPVIWQKSAQLLLLFLKRQSWMGCGTNVFYYSPQAGLWGLGIGLHSTHVSFPSRKLFSCQPEGTVSSPNRNPWKSVVEKAYKLGVGRKVERLQRETENLVRKSRMAHWLWKKQEVLRTSP